MFSAGEKDVAGKECGHFYLWIQKARCPGITSQRKYSGGWTSSKRTGGQCRDHHVVTTDNSWMNARKSKRGPWSLWALRVVEENGRKWENSFPKELRAHYSPNHRFQSSQAWRSKIHLQELNTQAVCACTCPHVVNTFLKNNKVILF